MEEGDRILWKPPKDISDIDIYINAKIERIIPTVDPTHLYKISIITDEQLDIPGGDTYYNYQPDNAKWRNTRWVSSIEVTRDYKYYREIKLKQLLNE